jgi:hypothetical protein
MLNSNRDLESQHKISLLDDFGYMKSLDEGEQWLVSLNVRSIMAYESKLKDLI